MFTNFGQVYTWPENREAALLSEQAQDCTEDPGSGPNPTGPALNMPALVSSFDHG